MKKKDAQKIMNELREDYNLTAPSFASSRDRLWPELKFLFDYAEEKEKILDLGCGNGRFSQYLQKTDYTGIDFSEEMIKEARKRFPKKKFLVGNALQLPFEKEIFDKIYSIAVIHQIPLHEYRLKFLFEAERVLRSDGFLILTAWNMQGEMKERCKKHFPEAKDIFLKRKRYYYLFEEEELVSLVKEAGFTIKEKGIVSEKERSNFYIVANKQRLAYNKKN